MWPSGLVPAQILDVSIAGTSSMNMPCFLKSSEEDRWREEAGKGGRRSMAQTQKQALGPGGSLPLALPLSSLHFQEAGLGLG